MHAQGLAAVGVRAVQHNVVGLQELAARHDLEAQAEHVSAIDGVGIGIVDLEGGDGGGDAVEALLVVGLLLLGAGEEELLVAVDGLSGLARAEGGGFGGWLGVEGGDEGFFDGGGGEDG